MAFLEGVKFHFLMSDEELLLFNAQGFIPGPKETADELKARIEAIHCREQEGVPIPRAHLEWVRVHLKEIFDFRPDSLPVFYSNRSLAIWQGAATWIEDGKIAYVQLRQSLANGSYFGYERDEILAHEAVHAARSAFNEPKTEEFFAYMTSEKWWRRALGPIIQRPWEAWPFIICLLGGLIFPPLHLGGALWISMGSWRLFRLHRRIQKAAKCLMTFVQDLKRARAILFRLTDREIEMIASGLDIFVYARAQSCLRWRLIRLAYLESSRV